MPISVVPPEDIESVVPAANYATAQDYTDYVAAGFEPTDSNEIVKLLLVAELDIDSILRPATIEANGRKFGHPLGDNEKNLTDLEIEALRRATCAQAEYRQTMGPEFFIRAQYERVVGPDFTTEGQISAIGPKVGKELAGTSLRIPKPVLV